MENFSLSKPARAMLRRDLARQRSKVMKMTQPPGRLSRSRGGGGSTSSKTLLRRARQQALRPSTSLPRISFLEERLEDLSLPKARVLSLKAELTKLRGKANPSEHDRNPDEPSFPWLK